jgi:hypothetical protein
VVRTTEAAKKASPGLSRSAGRHESKMAISQDRETRVPSWLQGALFGDLIWAVALVLAYTFEAAEPFFPKWMNQLDLIDTFGSICLIIAAPIAVGGWLVIWGDNGPPYQWLESRAFNILFAICFYAVLGGLVGLLFARKWPGRFTALKLLITLMILILFGGIAPLLWEVLD